MDIKALYPSLELDTVIHLVGKMIDESDLVIEGADWEEIGKYIMVLYGEIVELRNVLPKRAKGPRKLALSYLDKDLDSNKEIKWVWSRDLSQRPPDGLQKQMMIVLMMKAMVSFVMTNHIYQTGDQFYVQETGGPIGLKLTTTLAEIVMGEWDKQFNRLMEIRELKLPVYKRYVDDVDIVYEIGTGGTTGDLIEDVAHIMVEANSIIDCIQMEEDVKDNHPDGKVPILDLKVWVENDEMSAMSSMKRLYPINKLSTQDQPYAQDRRSPLWHQR